MAKVVSRHVKAKTAWKTVEIPQQLVDNELFDGLIDVQELTDYELVSGIDAPEIVASPTKSAKKRKKKNELESSAHVVLEKEKVDHTSGGDISATSEPAAKKRKKLKKTPENAHNIIEASDLIDINSSDFDQSHTFKSKTINVPRASQDENVDQKKQQRKKKKKKKKKNHPESLQKNIGSTRKVEENESRIPDAVTVHNTTEKDMSQWKNLFVPEELLCSLQEQGFVSPTEIQILTLPSAIRDKKDILGAAETGSGKTLAFGIPVLAQILSLQKLESKEDATENESDDSDMSVDEEIANKISSTEKPSKMCGPKALILEPTRELAVQVRKHLTRLASHTNIKFATVVGGMSVDKQYRILKQAPDVIIATPGRLWQLIDQGEEHLSQVDYVHSLVVDEADRMVEKGHYEELTKLLHYINESPRKVKKRQTYVMSATLTMEIAVPHRVRNKAKKKTQEDSKLSNLTDKICVGTKPKIIDLTTKDKVAQTLTELRINCALDEKDFYLFYFLCQHPGRTLVFVNSKDCLRRLVSLFTLLKCSPLPLHADMHQTQRLKNLDRFANESKALLIASDVAARGLDIKFIDHVVHYQVPRTVENYVHRSGRTARALNQGSTVMFVGAEDAKNYRKIVQIVKNGKEIPIMPLDLDLMPAVKKRVEMARSIDVKEHRSKKKKTQNNFFQKAAQDMDMILDDDKLLLDLGSAVKQSQEKQNLKSMKQHLSDLLKKPLAPLLMTKYPTKSGQLMSKKIISLPGIS